MAVSSLGPRVRVYLVGFAVGVLLLMVIPLPRPERRERPGFLERGAPGALDPVTVTDARGVEVTLPRPARRIVSLAPSLSETLFALRAGDLVVGRTRFCSYPAGLAEVPAVGGIADPDPEAVLALRPDVVLATPLTPPAVLDRLAALRLPVVVLAQGSEADLLADVQLLARLLAAPGEALRLTRDLAARRAAVAASLAGVRDLPPRRTLLVYDLDALASAAPGTWPGDLVVAAHAVNLAADAGSPWPRLAREAVLARDPEVLLVALPADPAARAAVERRVASLAEDPFWRHVRAVREGRVATVPEELLQIPGPRFPDAAEAIARGIWGDRLPADLTAR